MTAPEVSNYDMTQQAMPDTADDIAKENWLRRHKSKLGVAAFIGAAALTFNELGPIKDQIEESAQWTVPALITSESIATAGLAAMVASTGNKIGNPLTFRKRIKEFTGKLSNSSLYRSGAYMNLAGAVSTSAIVAAETVNELPVNAWPLGLGVAGLSTALSLPFYRLARSKRTEANSEEETATGDNQ